ncbi:helix-turn-helix domain-containing protein [Patescibacteria group bacterium]|nr:helix-turn-helix domain-containing protein [Patescibacteria group bacterium]
MRGNFFYNRLGQCIVKIRERKQLSQEQVAFRCDVDRTYISRIEKGHANPTIKILQKLASALQVKLHTLLKNLCLLLVTFSIWGQLIEILEQMT